MATGLDGLKDEGFHHTRVRHVLSNTHVLGLDVSPVRLIPAMQTGVKQLHLSSPYLTTRHLISSNKNDAPNQPYCAARRLIQKGFIIVSLSTPITRPKTATFDQSWR